MSPLVCEQLKEEAQARIAIAALQRLRQLINSLPLLGSMGKPHCCAESLPGGPHAQQQECELLPAQVPLRDRRGLERASRSGEREL